MFSLRQVLLVHAELLKTYGGSTGIINIGNLESALSRPFQTFGQTELYPSPHYKAAAILHSIILNHPFIDGNKRTAFYLAVILLLSYDLEITASEDQNFNFLINIAKGEMEFEAIVTWLIENTKQT